jgi:hypothetical protein
MNERAAADGGKHTHAKVHVCAAALVAQTYECMMRVHSHRANI